MHQFSKVNPVNHMLILSFLMLKKTKQNIYRWWSRARKSHRICLGGGDISISHFNSGACAENSKSLGMSLHALNGRCTPPKKENPLAVLQPTFLKNWLQLENFFFFNSNVEALLQKNVNDVLLHAFNAITDIAWKLIMNVNILFEYFLSCLRFWLHNIHTTNVLVWL